MRPRYVLSGEAQNDLRAIWEFTADNWSENQADDYFDALISELNHLSDFPYSGIQADHLFTGCRVRHCKSHSIFYGVDHNSIILVVRILHQSMNVEEKLQ